MCPDCDEYAVDFEIHGPAQLRRVVAKLQAAIKEERLRPDQPNQSHEQIAQPDFVDLDLNQSIPDVITYCLKCSNCGQAFKLQCESYHGSGGSWQCV